ncbi:uncharacterized protein LOC119668136 [Teleopsis dalmanni]|uniref:uncharacterized protein LOC119668135 n=1 Tax=Teleopsis dalmanni TaxID=139649 RepID=UPI0018CD7620|nr:uncharacterized protein LOC119668135 [Teleopsis dalmanni]XP_037933471.1 uncharacterized protein LOC119668136 [Teleopsis dalmanni]
MPKEDPFVNRAQLLKAIKKYPEIWDSNNKLHMCRSVTAPMWNEIAEQFGGHVPTVKLQSIWSQMKYHYHNLVHRQILHKDRFTTKWEHFEPMSFMYNITVAKIVGTNTSQESNQAVQHINPSASQTAQSQTQGRGRPSGSFTWLPTAPVQHDINVENNSYMTFTGLVPPAAITVEATTTPMRKPGRPGPLNNSMRGRIIDAIRNHSILWAGKQRDQRQGQNRTSAIWKEVANELGLTPSLLQTRWSIIKQRYVDELQKERHSHYTQQVFHSTWEHFDRMSFMRDILARKVDEREQTREHIQEIVSEQQHMQTQHLRFEPRNSTMVAMQTGLTAAEHAGMVYDEGVAMSLGLTSEGPVLSGAVHGLTPNRRRVKTEHDLEWDPFEMILHVQGTETTANK